MIIYVLLFAALYFFLIRPSQKKKKAEQEMRNSISIGDEVITIGGIVGRIVAVKDDDDAFIIETGSDRVKMKFKSWAISSVIKDEDKQPKVTEKASEEKTGLFGRKKKKKEDKNNEL